MTIPHVEKKGRRKRPHPSQHLPRPYGNAQNRDRFLRFGHYSYK